MTGFLKPQRLKLTTVVWRRSCIHGVGRRAHSSPVAMIADSGEALPIHPLPPILIGHTG